jgi:hypothetical protein
MNGNTLLSKISKIDPSIIRILFSAGNDLGLTQYAVNKIGIFRFIKKDETFDRIRSILQTSAELYYKKLETKRSLENNHTALSIELYQKRAPVLISIAKVLKFDEQKFDSILSLYPSRILSQKKSALLDWETTNIESTFVDFIAERITNLPPNLSLSDLLEIVPFELNVEFQNGIYMIPLIEIDAAIYNTSIEPHTWEKCAFIFAFLMHGCIAQYTIKNDGSHLYFYTV